MPEQFKTPDSKPDKTKYQVPKKDKDIKTPDQTLMNQTPKSSTED